MNPPALLELTTELLHRVLQFKQPADGIVSDFFREHRALGQRERHTLAETTYTVLRQRPLLLHLAQSGRGEIERRLAILGWQGNEAFLLPAGGEQRHALGRLALDVHLLGPVGVARAQRLGDAAQRGDVGAGLGGAT